jgi:hypothetical protein
MCVDAASVLYINVSKFECAKINDTLFLKIGIWVESSEVSGL